MFIEQKGALALAKIVLRFGVSATLTSLTAASVSCSPVAPSLSKFSQNHGTQETREGLHFQRQEHDAIDETNRMYFDREVVGVFREFDLDNQTGSTLGNSTDTPLKQFLIRELSG